MDHSRVAKGMPLSNTTIGPTFKMSRYQIEPLGILRIAIARCGIGMEEWMVVLIEGFSARNARWEMNVEERSIQSQYFLKYHCR